MNETGLTQSFGAIGAALIAGAIAYIVSVLSKEQKTSEFRQAWVDGLRSEISSLVAHASMVSFAVTAMREQSINQDTILEFLYSKHDDLIMLRTYHSSIFLRLNPEKHKELIKRVDNLVNLQPLEATDDKISELSELVEIEAQHVLKKEWTRVKQGEPVFRWTKRIAISVMLLSIIFGILLLSDYVSISYKP